MRRAVIVVMLAVAVLVAPACKREEDKKEEVKRALDRTLGLSRQFVYLDDDGSARVQVVGLIEDDFRHKARLSVDGAAVVEEVASDDALAMRFLEPSLLPRFLTNGVSAPTAATAPASGAIPVVDALRTRRWVLDPEGAPDLQGTAGDQRLPGQDPVFDALTAAEYVRRAVDAAIQVKLYSRDDFDPVYKAKEDPFPQPPQESKTKRYDLRPPRLPAPQGGSGNQAVPTLANFRKMVIYVRDGRVVQVLERIDLAGKLGEVITRLSLPDDTTAEQAAQAINAVRRGQGAELIRVRTMRLEFSDLGGTATVELPSDVVQGSLTLIKGRGRRTTGAAAATAPPAGP